MSQEDKNRIKDFILDKKNIEPLENNTQDIYIYIYQPFGSQNYPDFLIFTEHWILPLEIKFSTKTRQLDKTNELFLPKWNSNLPKSNAIYIFATASDDITYFMGSDFLGTDTRNLLLEYFEELDNKEYQENLKENLKKLSTNKNPFGLKPYIRKDYIYHSDFRTYLEHNVSIFEYSKMNNWETNVDNFLESLVYEK